MENGTVANSHRNGAAVDPLGNMTVAGHWKMDSGRPTRGWDSCRPLENGQWQADQEMGQLQATGKWTVLVS